MNAQNTIWFVIVTYKPDNAALRRLASAVSDFRVITIDNTEKNIGYGAAANQGMARAFEAGARWVVVCNQDITLTKHGIAHFIQSLEQCPPGIVGPEAGTLDPKRWTTVLASRPGPALPAGRLVPDDGLLYSSGSMIALHNDVWLATGGFYEPYFMYYEDVDLSVRAKRAGFPLSKVEIEGFRHGVPGPSFTKRFGWAQQARDDKFSKEYYLARNHLLFVRRVAPVSVKLHELLRLPKSIAEHSATGNTEAIRGVSDFAMGRFGKRI